MGFELSSPSIIIFMCFILFITFLNLSLLFAWRNRALKPPKENQTAPSGWVRDEKDIKALSQRVHKLKMEKLKKVSEQINSNERTNL